MAEPQGQKRQRAEESSQSGNQPLSKKVKTASELEHDAWYSWTYPPEFYDRLSKISLTTLALRELRRRTNTQRFCPPRPVESSFSILSGIQRRQDVTRSARRGGPDLSDLRGYPFPPVECQQAVAMNTGQSKNVSIAPQSVVSPATQAAKMTRTSQKTSPYDSNFDLHLRMFYIYPSFSSQKPDMTDLRAFLATPLPSQTLAQFSQNAFIALQTTFLQAKTKNELLVHVLPILLGTGLSEYSMGHEVIFGNCTPITDGTTMLAKPTIYDGVSPLTISKHILDQLSGLIIPSQAGDKAVVPNFFVEVANIKNLEVAELQARYHGAIGARAMHSLQNYMKPFQEYDGMTYTFSFTLCGMFLQVFAHHITPPVQERLLPEYHMNLVDSFSLASTYEKFIEGLTAFRNCRRLAKKWRDTFAYSANYRWSSTFLHPIILDTNGGHERQVSANVIKNVSIVKDPSGQSEGDMSE